MSTPSIPGKIVRRPRDVASRFAVRREFLPDHDRQVAALLALLAGSLGRIARVPETPPAATPATLSEARGGIPDVHPDAPEPIHRDLGGRARSGGSR